MMTVHEMQQKSIEYRFVRFWCFALGLHAMRLNQNLPPTDAIPLLQEAYCCVLHAAAVRGFVAIDKRQMQPSTSSMIRYVH